MQWWEEVSGVLRALGLEASPVARYCNVGRLAVQCCGFDCLACEHAAAVTNHWHTRNKS
jgi:hypothetical protein